MIPIFLPGNIPLRWWHYSDPCNMLVLGRQAMSWFKRTILSKICIKHAFQPNFSTVDAKYLNVKARCLFFSKNKSSPLHWYPIFNSPCHRFTYYIRKTEIAICILSGHGIKTWDFLKNRIFQFLPQYHSIRWLLLCFLFIMKTNGFDWYVL